MEKKKFSWKLFWKGAAVILLLAWTYDMTFNYVDWRSADRSSAGIAPKPEEAKEAIVQVYVARTYNWRGYFAVHSWIATKEKNAKAYTTYQVAGFYLWRTGSSVLAQTDIPDRRWYGREPILWEELRGEEAEKAIPEIKKAVAEYPYNKKYVMWPGPNSNTFISYIIREVPELKIELPPHAIGKDFIGYDRFVADTESGTGKQVSLWGILGISVGKAEGIEINILGLNFGLDFLQPALKLPLIGRIGVKDMGVKNAKAGN